MPCKMRSISARFMYCSRLRERIAWMSALHEHRPWMALSGFTTYLQETIQVDPLIVQRSRHMVNRILDSIILRHEVNKSARQVIRISPSADSLIMHNRDPAHHLIHANLATLLKIRHALFPLHHHVLHLLAHGIADLLHCLEARHLISDCWFTRREIFVSLDEVLPRRLE